MVRMCDVMTLACATVLAAGTVASASDKAALQPAGQDGMPGSLRQAVGNFPALQDRGGISSECFCDDADNSWDNGQWSGLDGQVSHEGGGAMDGAKAADDFYLCEGEIHQLRSIRGTLLSNSLIRRARLEIYEDCNGCPSGDPIYVLTHFETPVQSGTTVNGYVELEYEFVIDEFQESGDPDVDDDCVQSIALHGGVYWVSLIGLTDGQGTDLSFFGTAESDDSEIKGSVAKKAFGIPVAGWDTFSYGSWISVEDCCVGCTDLAFDVCFDSCKILIDNGFENRTFGNICAGGAPANALYRSGARSERSPLVRNSRAADDFVVAPCRGEFTVCYIEGCIYTNCILDCDGDEDQCGRGFYEIYDNDCRYPDYEPTGTPAPRSGYATHAFDLNYCVRMNGGVASPGNPIVRAYRLEFHDITGLTLTGGRNYWISLGVDDSYSFIEQAWFCYNNKCNDPCLVRFNSGVVWDPSNTNGYVPALDEEEWVSNSDINIDQTGSNSPNGDGIGRDHAFLVAGFYTDTVTGGGSSEPACTADFNQDTNVTVEDIFAFLSSWFAGCP